MFSKCCIFSLNVGSPHSGKSGHEKCRNCLLYSNTFWLSKTELSAGALLPSSIDAGSRLASFSSGRSPSVCLFTTLRNSNAVLLTSLDMFYLLQNHTTMNAQPVIGQKESTNVQHAHTHTRLFTTVASCRKEFLLHLLSALGAGIGMRNFSHMLCRI